MKYLNHKQYYRKLLFERFKAYFMTITFLGIVIISPIWLIIIVLTSSDTTDKLNECLKINSLNYCNRNIK
jgi:hypothetical protein